MIGNPTTVTIVVWLLQCLFSAGLWMAARLVTLLWYRPLCFCHVNALHWNVIYTTKEVICIKLRSSPALLPFNGQNMLRITTHISNLLSQSVVQWLTEYIPALQYSTKYCSAINHSQQQEVCGGRFGGGGGLVASDLLFGGAEKKLEKTETLWAGTHLNFYFVALLVFLV